MNLDNQTRNEYIKLFSVKCGRLLSRISLLEKIKAKFLTELKVYRFEDACWFQEGLIKKLAAEISQFKQDFRQNPQIGQETRIEFKTLIKEIKQNSLVNESLMGTVDHVLTIYEKKLHTGNYDQTGKVKKKLGTLKTVSVNV